MPEYNAAATSKPNLQTGYPSTLWNAEAPGDGSPVAGISSQAFALHRDPNLPSCFSVQVEFSGNPGAFQLDVQTADTDAEKYYVTNQSVTTGLNASFVLRIEVLNVVAKFMRLQMVSMANAVTVTAKVF
jgi:hypothetical protein